ncbi:MAG: glutathione S-transferase family protein [Pseudomonadota bacterium]
MYTLIGSTRTRALRVSWMLEELGQDYTQVQAGPGSEEARRHNPLGKIPALVDGEAVLTDSVAIMTYLGDKHGALTAPAGTPKRAQQDAMTLWIIDEMDAVLWCFAKHTVALPEDARVPAITPGLHFEYERTLATLSERLGNGPFLMGDAITIPDLLAVHCLGWGHLARFPAMDARLKGWARELRERPAYQRALARV